MIDITKGMKFFKVLSHGIALIPGLLVFTKALPIPPGFSPLLMAGLQEVACGFIVAFAWVNGSKVAKWNARRFNQLVVFSFLAFIVFFLLYIYINQSIVINSQKWGKLVFIPLWSNAEVEKEGGFQFIYDNYGVDDLKLFLETQCQGSVFLTKACVYLSFVLLFVFLTIMFTLMWLKFSAMNQKAAAIKQKLSVKL